MIDPKERDNAKIKALKERKENQKELKVSDFIIPVLGLVVLALLTFFIYIPMIQEATEINDSLEVEAGKIDFLEDLLVNLKSVDAETLDTDYVSMTGMVPNRMEVADFAYYVDELAMQEGLTLERISASSQKSALVSESYNVEDLYGVTGPLRYKGYYGDIVSFIDGLSSYSPYIIKLSSLKMNRNSQLSTELDPNLYTQSVWTIDTFVTGFYISEESDTGVVDIYLPYVRYDTDQELIDIMRSRASKLSE